MFSGYEGWKNLVYLPKSKMFPDDMNGTVDGIHPNDWGMASLATAYGNVVKQALRLPKKARALR